MFDIPALADFRQQTRIWLEQNCPAEMRQPMLSEEEACWGGRNWQFGSEAQQGFCRDKHKRQSGPCLISAKV